MLKSYILIEKISKTLYLNNKNEKEIHERLNELSGVLSETISMDFKTLFGQELLITKILFYVNDVTYRQSATGCIMKGIVSKDSNFRIKIENLIDHGKILLKVKSEPDDVKLKKISDMIKEAYNYEQSAELKEIKTGYNKRNY